jgi:hypothetical protein
MISPLDNFEQVFTDGDNLIVSRIDDKYHPIEFLKSFMGRQSRRIEHAQAEIGAIELLP